MAGLGSKLAKGLVKKLGGGGLNDLLGKFDNKKTESWVATGANEAITAEEVKTAIAPAELEELAREADVTTEEAAAELAEVIPEAVDTLTPEGQVPQEASLNEMVETIVHEEMPAEAPSGEVEATPAPEAAVQTYTVVSGDTLSAIAQRFYGNAGDYMRIFEANRDKLNDPNLIHPGQELVIPQ
jgi:nucleoid-associated protein YgaU